MITVSDARPTAIAVLQPVGSRVSEPREHSLTITLSLSGSEPRFADKRLVTDVLRRALESFACGEGDDDRRTYTDVSMTTRGRGREAASTTVVVSVEASVVMTGRPAVQLIEEVVRLLSREGYRVSMRERRECSEATCHSEALLDWQHTPNPPGWFSTAICGKHDYRTCLGCKSVFLLHAESSIGQAPSLACEVCGAVLVSWGGSKLWTAELVARQPGSA